MQRWCVSSLSNEEKRKILGQNDAYKILSGVFLVIFLLPAIQFATFSKHFYATYYS